MWKTERGRWDPPSRVPGTNDGGKETLHFFTRVSHFQATYVALGCTRFAYFPVCTGFRGGVAGLSDQFGCFSQRDWKGLTSHPTGQVFRRQKKVLSHFSTCEPIVIVIGVVLIVHLTSPLVMGEHTTDIKQSVWQQLHLRGFRPENVREKSRLAFVQRINHQTEV